VTKLATILHVAAGTVALLAGIIAMSSRKGARVHRVTGTLFCGTFTIYLVATAWMTLRRKQRSVGVPEKTALSIVVCLCVPFAILSFQAGTGLKPSCLFLSCPRWGC
jgi:biotin transporter BioY